MRRIADAVTRTFPPGSLRTMGYVLLAIAVLPMANLLSRDWPRIASVEREYEARWKEVERWAFERAVLDGVLAQAEIGSLVSGSQSAGSEADARLKELSERRDSMDRDIEAGIAEIQGLHAARRSYDENAVLVFRIMLATGALALAFIVLGFELDRNRKNP